MKKKSLLIILGFVMLSYYSQAQHVGKTHAETYASNWLSENKASFSTEKHQPLIDQDGHILAHCYSLNPEGFLVLSANRSLPPVIAYSFEGAIDIYKEGNPLRDLIMIDLNSRNNYLTICSSSYKEKNQALWDVPPSMANRSFQQWPPDGSTSTGGWLETNWKQSHPCNIFCPMDQNSGERSLAGCPSVALAMIIDYQKNLNGTEFGDNDDYYHSYIGGQFWIDDDYEAIEFLSFDQINKYFDSIAIKYSGYELLNEEEVAALIFACGVAAEQVYSSNGSGTFGVDQAFSAYQRFGYMDAELIYVSDTSLFTRMKNNMIEGLPVHYAILSSTGSGGHNVVVDGYNTENYYHVNFGWGGNYNAWYLLPDELPYNLTISDGSIVDIGVTHVGLNENLSSHEIELSIFPNPSRGGFNIQWKLDEQEEVMIEIYNIFGTLINSFKYQSEPGIIHTFRYDQNIASGQYFIRLSSDNMSSTKKIMILP